MSLGSSTEVSSMEALGDFVMSEVMLSVSSSELLSHRQVNSGGLSSSSTEGWELRGDGVGVCIIWELRPAA